MSGFLKQLLHKNNWRWWQISLFVIFFAWFIGANLWLAYSESQTIDEAVHLTAGYSYITTKDFRLNPEHPPLLKELSALPLLTLDVKNVKDLNSWESASEWKAAKEFVYQSKSSPRTIIFMARLMPIVIAVLLGLLVFLLATYFTNKSFGLVALGLYCLDPNIIAHSHLVTTDVASAFGILLTLTSLFYYVNRPNLRRLLLVGLCLGIALSFKFSTLLILLFVALLVALSIYINNKNLKTGQKMLSFAKKMAFILIIAGLFLFATYGFEVVKPGNNTAMAGNLANDNAVYNTAKNLYIPMYSYLRGFGRVFLHVKDGSVDQLVYIMGNYSGSQWYYFLLAALIKTPLITILLTIFSLSLGLVLIYKLFQKSLKLSKLSNKYWYILTLLVFVLTYLAVSALTAINITWRYILPIYPIVFILIAVSLYNAANYFKISNFKMLIISGVSLLLLAISLALQWPYTLSYSNELLKIVDTKTNTIRLYDSNIDWSQDIYRLIDYVKANPNNVYKYDLFTNVNLSALGAPENLQLLDKTSSSDICNRNYPANIVLSYQVIYGSLHSDFSCFRGIKPDITVGSSIVIFSQR